MKIYKKASIHILTACLLLFVTTTIVYVGKATAYEYFNWNAGFAGYEIAMMDAEKNGSPLIIYFYLDSDELTKKMNNEYILTDQVKNFLTDIPKVAIDADYDKKYNGLSRNLGIENFPALLISIPSLKTEIHKVHPFSENNQMTIDDFIDEIKKFFTYHYNIKAYSLFEEKNYEMALELLEKSIELDNENPYTYHVMGVIYHTIGAEKKDSDILTLAKENYKKVLEFDPENEEVKDELNKIISAHP